MSRASGAQNRPSFIPSFVTSSSAAAARTAMNARLRAGAGGKLNNGAQRFATFFELLPLPIFLNGTLLQKNGSHCCTSATLMSNIKWRVSVAMRICSMWVDVLVLRLLTLARSPLWAQDKHQRYITHRRVGGNVHIMSACTEGDGLPNDMELRMGG